MANVSIKFNGKEFLLSCEDGQEEHLEELLIKIVLSKPLFGIAKTLQN